MEILLEIPQGKFKIQRIPLRKNELLRAWDAADEYLLNYLASDPNFSPNKSIVILNDSFGAISVSLHVFSPCAISDSYLSHLATRHNLLNNGIEETSVTLLDSLSIPVNPIDYLLIKIPKTLALLEYQLHQLRPLLKHNSKIILAGMIKNMPNSVWKLVDRLIGSSQTSLAVKKARLIFAQIDFNLVLSHNPYPVTYQLENSSLWISNHANVFSRDNLDIGTRFLLQNLPMASTYRNYIDLGCGNGIVGLILAQTSPQVRLKFVDESFMAIASARQNYLAAGLDLAKAEFVIADSLSHFEPESADCIICNPPFHQQQTIGVHIAQQMFQESFRTLAMGGELRIIGNRHLPYKISLKNLFGNVEKIAGNEKFLIYRSIKTGQ